MGKQRFARAATGLALAFAWTLSAATFATQTRADTLKIGLLLPITGPSALLAEQFQQGARLAVADLAPDDDVELVVADDGCETAGAELAAADLRAAGVSLATGFLCNEAAFAAARVLRSTGIPILVAGARSERLLKDRAREKWNVWRLAPADRDAALVASETLAQRWRGRPWAVVDDGTAFGRTFADEFRALMEEAGQPPQFADNFRPAQSTQAGLVRRLRSSGVTAVFIAASAEDTAIVVDGVRQSDAEFELAGGPSLDMLPWIEGADTVPDGLLAVVLPDPATLEPARDLSDRLAEAGIEPERYVYLGYAAMEIAIAATRTDPAETATNLADTVFATVLGNVDFDESGRNRTNPYRLQIWRNGGFRPLAQGEQ